MATTFTQLFLEVEKLGVLDSLIPFLLIFIIIFAVLEKTQIMGVHKKNINMVIALSIGLLVVIPHIIGRYPPGQDPVTIMNQAIPNVSLVMVAVIMALILAGVFGFQFVGGGLTGGVLLISAGTVMYFFGKSAGWWDAIIPNIDPSTRSLIIAILVFGIIIFFITRDDGKGTDLGGWYKGLSNSLKRIEGGH